MLARDIAAALSRDAEGVAAMLLPNGKRDGAEWRVGSLDGEEGQSLGVHLTGSKAGVWKDFAGGKGGDLLDLWREVRGLTMLEAMEQAAKHVGMDLHPVRKSSKPFTKPRPPRGAGPASGAALDYLCNERGLGEQTVRAYRVGSDERSILFPFFADGQLHYLKRLDLERPNGKKRISAEPGCQPILFGWQAIPESARTLVITEGEIDAMSVHQLGYPAVSVPNGAGKGAANDWIEHDFDRLGRFDEIYLCFDQDEAGRKALEDVAGRLGSHRVKLVELPTKDANELLLAGGDVAAAIANAKDLLPKDMVWADAHLDDVLARAFPDCYPSEAQQLFETPWRKSDGELMFRAGEVAMVCGYNGSGKSQLTQHLTLQQMYRGHTVCMASLEMHATPLLTRMVRQAAAMKDPSEEYMREILHWMGERLLLFSAGKSAPVDKLIDAFTYARQRFDTSVFVVDNLAKCGMAEDDYNGQKVLVDRLTDFANAHGVLVLLVAHTRKGASEHEVPGKMDVKGTGAITDMVDTVCMLWRNKPKEEAEQAGLDDSERGNNEKTDSADACLRVVKQRHGEWEGQIWLWFDPDSMQYVPAHQAKPFRYVGYER